VGTARTRAFAQPTLCVIPEAAPISGLPEIGA
jgi:hypothetical protein